MSVKQRVELEGTVVFMRVFVCGTRGDLGTFYIRGGIVCKNYAE